MEKKALTRMQQELANQVTTTQQQQHQETLQQTFTTAQHTHELVQQLRTAQAGPVDIQYTDCSERRRKCATNHENDVDIIKHHIRRQKPQ